MGFSLHPLTLSSDSRVSNNQMHFLIYLLSGCCRQGSSDFTLSHADIYYFKLFILLLLCPVSSPRRFRAKVLSPTQLQVSWKEPKGEFEGYNVIYTTLPGKTSRHVSVSSPTFTQHVKIHQNALRQVCSPIGWFLFTASDKQTNKHAGLGGSKGSGNCRAHDDTLSVRDL